MHSYDRDDEESTRMGELAEDSDEDGFKGTNGMIHHMSAKEHFKASQ